MRMNKFMVGLLVLGLAVGVFGAIALAGNGHGNNASDTAIDSVSWTVQGFIELTIADNTFDFGQIDAGVDSASETEANTLHVSSNTAWVLSYSVGGTGSSQLDVDLSSGAGTGNSDITVGYSLTNLRSMDPGTYTATVTYTVAAE